MKSTTKKTTHPEKKQEAKQDKKQATGKNEPPAPIQHPSHVGYHGTDDERDLNPEE